MLVDVAWFVVLVLAVLGIGLAIGMLAAPLLTRWAERDEEPVDRDD